MSQKETGNNNRDPSSLSKKRNPTSKYTHTHKDAFKSAQNDSPSFHPYSFIVCTTTTNNRAKRWNLSLTSLHDTWNRLFLSNFLNTAPFSSTNCNKNHVRPPISFCSRCQKHPPARNRHTHKFSFLPSKFDPRFHHQSSSRTQTHRAVFLLSFVRSGENSPGQFRIWPFRTKSGRHNLEKSVFACSAAERIYQETEKRPINPSESEESVSKRKKKLEKLPVFPWQKEKDKSVIVFSSF